ncbi:MAG: hypothetical protein RLZZ387_1574 [Chloroflexota bacterium]|jgi:tetratricopeptide (TPR) repeat protein
MTTQHNTWVQGYLRALAERRAFRNARSVPPLWLAGEGGHTAERGAPARATIQMAAEISPRLVVAGTAGSGKTTALRQLAAGAAEALLAVDDQGGARGQSQRTSGAALPLPIYLELARFTGDVPAALAADFGPGVPTLAELAHSRPLLFLLDGLDELPAPTQLTSLSALTRTLSALGTQVRWVATCTTESLPLFRPWLGPAEVRVIQPLRGRDALAAVQQQTGEDLASWLEGAHDLAALATRPRWLRALGAAAGDIAAPYSRGRVLGAWLRAVVAETVETHGWAERMVDVVGALPALAAELEQRQQDVLPAATAAEALEHGATHHLTDGDAVSRLLPAILGISAVGQDRGTSGSRALDVLLAAGILTLDAERQQVSFQHPALQAFAHGLLLARSAPERWPASVIGRASSDAVVFAYSLSANREAVLQRLLTSGAVTLAARCLMDAEPADEFNALLERSGTLTPPLRILLADAFAAEELLPAAREQLERAAAEGYDEAGLFGRLGELYVASGNWRRARAAYEQALAREPGDLRYRQQLGVVCSRLGDFDRASAALEAVLDVQQRRSAAAAAELGAIYQQQGQLERALAAFRQAATSLPEPPYRRQVASVLRLLGRTNEAEVELRALLESGGDASAYAELGQVLADSGRAQEAAAVLGKAVALAPAEPSLYMQLGRLRQATGDAAGARAALQRAVELVPDDAALHYELGRVAEASGEYESALASYRHATRLEPSSGVYLRALGALLRERGDDDGAVAALRGALELHPDSAEAHAELATLLWRTGHREQAMDEYRRALVLAPDNVDIEQTLGLAHHQLGQTREALLHLRRAADRAPTRADLQFDAAIVAEALGRHEEALTRYDRAATLAPNHPEYARAAAALYEQAGDARRARSLLAAALRFAPYDPATLHQVGQLHSRAGQWVRAVAALARATKAAPSPQHEGALGVALLEAGRVDEATEVFWRSLQAQPDDALLQHHYSRALAARGDLERAYRAARDAAQSAPGNSALQQNAGRLALGLGRWNEALELLDRAVALDSAEVTSHLGRAEALLALGQPEVALGAARSALDLAADSGPAALSAGIALAHLGRDDEARAMLDRAAANHAPPEPTLAALRDVCSRSGDGAAALSYARRAVELAPDSAQGLVRLGELLLEAGSNDEARSVFERVLEMADTSTAARAHGGLGQIEARAEAWSLALAHAEQAAAQEPESGERWALLAQVRAGAGDLRTAADAYDAALERVPNRADWLFDRGELLRRLAEPASALPSLRRAAGLSQRPEHHYAVAACLRELGDLAGAAESLERALRRRPTEQSWRVELAEILMARGWFGEAVAELSHAIEAAPEAPTLWRMRGEARLRMRQVDMARADLLQALKRDPRDGIAYELLAHVLLEQSFDARAIEAARRAVELLPARASARHMLARAHRALGRHAEASQELERALAAGGPAVWWADLAGDYEALGETVQARRAWGCAIEAAPADATLRLRLGSLLAQAGDSTAAIEQLREAVTLEPDLAAAHAQLAEALVSTSAEPAAIEEALTYARRAVALAPQSSGHWRALGAALRAASELGEAAETLRYATALDPSSGPAAFLLGITLLESGAPEAAADAFAAAVAAAPASADSHGYLGLSRLRVITTPADPADAGELSVADKGVVERALEALARAADLAPADPRWRQALGEAELARGGWAEAVVALGHAIRLGPIHQAETHRLRARALFLAGRAADARADIEHVLETGDPQPDDLYLLGRIAFTQSDFATARRSLEAAMEQEPAHAQARLYYGRTLIILGQTHEAVTALERATEQRPDHAPTAAALSDAYAAAGRHERALVSAARAVRLDSRAAENHQRLAALYATAGRLHEARAALINALTLRPDVAAWHAQMGDICTRLGMTSAAQSAFARAAELDPSEPAYRYAVAQALDGQGKSAEARHALDLAVSAAPERGGWRYELAQLHKRLGDPQSAHEQLLAAAQYAPDTAEHWRALAESQVTAGDTDVARETLERALLRFGDSAPLHAALGTLIEEAGEAETAAWHYTVATEQQPDHAEHWWRLGRAHLECGDAKSARPALERALALNPDAAEAHAALARIFAAEEDTRATLTHIQRAAELAPETPLFQVQLAEAYAHLRRFDEARQALERAVRLVPDDAELLIRYGEMALTVGQNREALQAFERAIEKHPEEPHYHFLAGRAHRRLKHYSRAIERFRRAVKLRPGYSEAIVELSTLGPLAFVAHHLRGEDDDQAAA